MILFENVVHSENGHVELDVKESLLAEIPLAKHHCLGRSDRVTRKHGIAVAEVEQARAAVVDAEDRVREARVDSQVVEMIEITRPAGPFVDFLERDDIRREPVEERGDLPQVHAELARAGEPLDGRQSAAMGDVERDES